MSVGIEGTYLTGPQYVTTQSAAETDLSDRYVQIDSLELPAGFPPASGAKGEGHMLTLVC